MCIGLSLIFHGNDHGWQSRICAYKQAMNKEMWNNCNDFSTPWSSFMKAVHVVVDIDIISVISLYPSLVILFPLTLLLVQCISIKQAGFWRVAFYLFFYRNTIRDDFVIVCVLIKNNWQP